MEEVSRAALLVAIAAVCSIFVGPWLVCVCAACFMAIAAPLKLLPVSLRLALAALSLPRRQNVQRATWLAFTTSVTYIHLTFPADLVPAQPPLAGNNVTTAPWRSVSYISVIADDSRLDDFLHRMAPLGLQTRKVVHQRAVYVASGKSDGVWKAFQSVARRALDRAAKATLIFEQDVRLYAEWDTALPEAVRAVSDGRCDVVALGGFCLAHGEQISPRISRAQCVGAEADIFSRDSLRRLVNVESPTVEIDDYIRSEMRLCAVIRPVAGQNDDYVANAIGYAAIELVYWFGRRLVPYSHYQLACLSLSSTFDRLRLGEFWWRSVDAALPGTR